MATVTTPRTGWRGAARRLRVATRVDRRHWRELASAQAAIVAAWLRVWIAGGRMIRVDDLQLPAAAVTPIDTQVIDRVVWAVDRAARFGAVRAHCLVRSMALQRRLVANDVGGAIVRVGVRRDNAVFEAHAWVEWRGRVIGDSPEHVRRFVPLEHVRLRDLA